MDFSFNLDWIVIFVELLFFLKLHLSIQFHFNAMLNLIY